MAVKIRLSRTGKKNRPSYRIVVIDESKKRDGQAIEILGSYRPLADKDQKVTFNQARLNYWLSVGARLTKTTAHLLKIS